ncbi:MAG: type II toxin-antitoxin system VapC family toxin [Bryobacteraceae bacterium]
MSQWIVDASITLGWYLKDEGDRTYNLEVLAGLRTNEALVPFLWTYEVANGLVMAQRRKRLADSDITTILGSLRTLPITVDSPDADKVLRLPVLAIKHRLTAYDSAYIELALRLKLPLATKDGARNRQ